MITTHQMSPPAFIQKVDVTKRELQSVINSYNVKLVVKNEKSPGKIAIWCWWKVDFCHLPGIQP